MLTLAAALSTPFLIIAWVAVVAAIVLAYVYAKRAQVIRGRLEAEHHTQFEENPTHADEEMGFLEHWMYVSGFRGQGAATYFLMASALAFVLGLVIALTLHDGALIRNVRGYLHELPGAIGTLADIGLFVIPWFIFFMVALYPWLYVRGKRRKRMKQIEEDFPITLQLLATLSRAGLGFDAALLRVLESGDRTRPLAEELEQFRRENMSGLPRQESWRRLATRVDVGSMSMFVSAMRHAEQVGGGISTVLEHQTEDVQSRRRERALIKAQGLQVKLVFPLVLCFLPGIFVWALGPAIYQFLKVFDGVFRGAGGSGL